MKHPSRSFEEARNDLLDQIAAITTMQPGTLTEEYRTGAPDEDGRPAKLGPYYKFQVWCDGANRSSRVPAEKAADLREDTANWRLFHDLCANLAQLNAEHTRALRDAQGAAATTGAKKNSARKRAAKGAPKRKPSSRGPGRS